ncbi:unnamed protein product [Dovyalis caffra]|uniref:Uncharacterized protein n=1 Tax=Dovyalis caffra TaxID=77055 RepID=A0AAV1S047_9ROSI|nr:unnamed protein product [Dovyalis caffra]
MGWCHDFNTTYYIGIDFAVLQSYDMQVPFCVNDASSWQTHNIQPRLLQIVQMQKANLPNEISQFASMIKDGHFFRPREAPHFQTPSMRISILVTEGNGREILGRSISRSPPPSRSRPSNAKGQLYTGPESMSRDSGDSALKIENDFHKNTLAKAAQRRVINKL